MSIQHIGHGMVLAKRTNSLITPYGIWEKGTDQISGINPFPGSYYLRESSSGDKIDIAPWGADNLQPLHWLKLLAESNIAPSMLNTKVDFAVGENIYIYREEIQFDEATDQVRVIKKPIEMNPRLQQWLKGIQYKKLLRQRATDYYFSGNCFSRIVPARDPGRFGIAFIDHIDACTVRSEVLKKGRVGHFYISEDWTKPKYNKKDRSDSNTVRYKAFSNSQPLEYRSIHHSKIYWPGQPYYGVQPWHSASNWIGFANRIPVWMTSNIDNSYNIKYHITYPDNYFDYTKNMSKEDAQKEKDRVFDEFDNWLAGKNNVGKTIYTKGKLDPMTGKLMEGWRIEPIANDIKDKAWMDAYKTSQSALTSGWDINPALANIMQEGKFTTSGSELRIAYQLHIALKVSAARAIMVEPLELAYNINHELGVPGFDEEEIKFGFINKNVLTIADSGSGITPNIEQDNL